MNKELYGKYFKIPDKIHNHLKNTLSNYNSVNGNQHKQGYVQTRSLVNKGEISYQQLKKIKNTFDSIKRHYHSLTAPEIKNTTEYKLNGGKIFNDWVENMLKDNRADIERIKNNKEKQKPQERRTDTSHRIKDSNKIPKTNESLRIVIRKSLIFENYDIDSPEWLDDLIDDLEILTNTKYEIVGKGINQYELSDGHNELYIKLNPLKGHVFYALIQKIWNSNFKNSVSIRNSMGVKKYGEFKHLLLYKGMNFMGIKFSLIINTQKPNMVISSIR